MRNTSLDSWVWLTGRGLSIACGFDWEPSPGLTDLPRDERITRLAQELADARSQYKVDTDLLDSLLANIQTRLRPGEKHGFMTLNWDSLLQEAVDRCAGTERQPAWMEDSQVYHLNGSFEGASEQWASSVLFPEDVPEIRRESPEFNSALAKLLWADRIVILGVSMRYTIDKTLLRILAALEDNLPVGEADVLVVDIQPQSLERELRRLLPAAHVSTVCADLKAWVGSGLPGLERFRPR